MLSWAPPAPGAPAQSGRLRPDVLCLKQVRVLALTSRPVAPGLPLWPLKGQPSKISRGREKTLSARRCAGGGQGWLAG